MKLRASDELIIQSERYREWFLSPAGSWVKTSRTDVMWTVLPAGLRWMAPASKDDRGNWKDLALSPHAEPLVGLEIMDQRGCGIINLRGLFGVGGSQSTPWTSDDSGGDEKSHRSPYPDDSITTLLLRNQNDYGIVDVSFTTRKGFRSDWFTKNPSYNQQQQFSFQVPADEVVVGLVGRKWPRH